MTHEPRTGAVLYAKDVDRMVAFYCGIVDLKIRSTQQDHVMLESPVFQLVILPDTQPHSRFDQDRGAACSAREYADQACLLCSEHRRGALAARSLGGGVNTVSQEWQFEESKICDGYDPEGNIFQLRDPVR